MQSWFESALNQGSAIIFALVFLAGILSVATPCVLPMVTITLGSLGVTEAASPKRAFIISSLYVVGIVITFVALGLFFGLSGSLFGSFLSHPIINVILAAIFIVLAASSFGLFEIQLPGFLTQRLVQFSKGQYQLINALMLGLIAGFIALPCIGPVLAGILAYVGTTQDALFGALILAIYAFGFGLPFMAVGIFALRLPKRGPWMLGVKSVFGLMLLLGAFWFLRTAIPFLREPRNIIFGSILTIAGIFIGAIHKHFGATAGDAWRKAIGVGLGALGAAILLNAILYSPPLDWCEEKADRACLNSACVEHETTVVDFWADWCIACKEIEKKTLHDPKVEKALIKIGRVRIDAGSFESIAEDYQVSGLPAILFLNSKCQPYSKRISGFVNPNEFLEILRQVQAVHFN